MIIDRIGETYYNKKFIDCRLYVRKDLTVAKATENYYVYVGDNNYYPVSNLIAPEDGRILLEAAGNLTDKVEMVTDITDSKGGIRTVYLRMENSDQTEDDKPLYLITLFDICDMESRTGEVEVVLAKYRHFMTLNSEFCNEYFFEYKVEENRFEIYKYVNERTMPVYMGSLDDFVIEMEQKNNPTDEQREQMQTFCEYLRKANTSFEMEFTMHNQGNISICCVKGSCLYKNKKLVAGIMIPEQLSEKEAYYLTPAARDAGTGLFNKKAITEYTLERLHLNDGRTRWFVLFDIDDFKDINDTFGHLFGDEVIRKVADVLQINVGYRGVVGRFGGDEFFVLLEKIPDRTSLKMLLRTITRELALAYDPKLKIKASIGVSQYPVDGTSYEKLFEKADKALYIAKAKGKDRHIIYEEENHGSLQKDEMKAVTVSYVVSKEKRKAALVDILSALCTQGVGYVTENPAVQKQLRELFDLDGITIITDYGRRVVCRNGIYNKAPEALHVVFRDKKMDDIFGENEALVEPNMLRMKALHAEAYVEYTLQEIASFVHCIARKDGKAHSLVCFDVLNRNRKWSDTESEMLTLIGNCVAKLLCEE